MTSWSDSLPNWVGFPTRISHAILLGVAIGTSLAITSRSLLDYLNSRRRLLIASEDHKEFSPRPIELRSDEIVDGVTGLIGTALPILYCLVPQHHFMDRTYASRANKLTKQCAGGRNIGKVTCVAVLFRLLDSIRIHQGKAEV